MIRTLTLVSRGKKYFTCKLPAKSYPVKLFINEISKELTVGQTFVFHVRDISKVNRYGATVIFEPLAVRTTECELKDFLDARQTLKQATDDAVVGRYKTDAIRRALQDAKPHPELQEALHALNNVISEAEQSHEKTKQQRVIFPLDALPEFNRPFRIDNNIIFYINSGKPFVQDSADVCYCYYRLATTEEATHLSLEEVAYCSSQAIDEELEEALTWL